MRREVLTCLFAGGHCLLRGVPGLAKTLLIKTLADATTLKFSRIQFTPDLMPSDILGTEVIEEDQATGKRHVRFIPGPIFANVILADEINRTPPRTQAALLEAMQEYQVTVGGVRYPLDRPLFVLATENPIEQEGTHPLPGSAARSLHVQRGDQLPGRRRRTADSGGDHDGAYARGRSRSRAAPSSSRRGCSCATCRPPRTWSTTRCGWFERRGRTIRRAPQPVREWVKWGAGPRAGQSLLLGAKAAALLDGRSVPEPADVDRVALPVLRHRLLLNFQAEADGLDADQVVGRILDAVRG